MIFLKLSQHPSVWDKIIYVYISPTADIFTKSILSVNTFSFRVRIIRIGIFICSTYVVIPYDIICHLHCYFHLKRYYFTFDQPLKYWFEILKKFIISDCGTAYRSNFLIGIPKHHTFLIQIFWKVNGCSMTNIEVTREILIIFHIFSP